MNIFQKGWNHQLVLLFWMELLPKNSGDFCLKLFTVTGSPVYPFFQRVWDIPGGAGFLPSTVASSPFLKAVCCCEIFLLSELIFQAAPQDMFNIDTTEKKLEVLKGDTVHLPNHHFWDIFEYHPGTLKPSTFKMVVSVGWFQPNLYWTKMVVSPNIQFVW